MGLAPVSAAVTGWVMQSIALARLFSVSGGILLVLALAAFALTPMRRMAEAPTMAR